MRTALPFAIFFLLLGLWTWKLLEPNPVPEAVGAEIPTDLKFLLSKCLHLAAYAVLAVLASFLPVRRPYFLAAIAVLAVHAVGTEVGQSYVPNRHGSARDVGINWAGIGAGLLLLRVWGAPRASSSNLLSEGRAGK